MVSSSLQFSGSIVADLLLRHAKLETLFLHRVFENLNCSQTHLRVMDIEIPGCMDAEILDHSHFMPTICRYITKKFPNETSHVEGHIFWNRQFGQWQRKDIPLPCGWSHIFLLQTFQHHENSITNAPLKSFKYAVK